MAKSSQILRAFWMVMVLALTTLHASAEEAILEFAGVVELLTDGAVVVTETITVRAEGRDIRRGIFRDIPTVLINDDGSKLRSALQDVSVTRDGDAEPFFTESIENGKRIYIGDSEVYLRPGVYTYEIKYRMPRMARRFADYDELYWNATGTYWDFPIYQSSVEVILPSGANIGDIAAYTGPFGSGESAARVARLASNHAKITTTRRLGKYEGLTVALSFQKGVLAERSDTDVALDYVSDRRDIILPALAALLVLLNYYFAWDKVGRDPRKGTIVPLFYPPKGFSPALTHYVWAMGWKKGGWQAFTAAIISLATKGLISIETKGKSTTMTVAGRLDNADPLPKGEAILFAHINAKSPLKISKTSGPALNTKRTEVASAIESENRERYFKNNVGYVVFGVLLSVACLVVLLIAGVLEIEWMFLAIFGGIFASVIVASMRAIWMQTGVFRFFRVAVLAFVAFNLATLLANVTILLPAMAIGAPAIAVVSIIIINVIFAMLMRAPTVQGRKIMDEIEGFRMYLETAEKERLNFNGEPHLTTARFEKILPYAIALGVEKPWSQRFEGELARNAVADARTGYDPGWYHGSSFSSANLGRDIAAISTGMSAAMIAAQPVSSSSSGSSGGGSSGGGGGGGGGGGW